MAMTPDQKRTLEGIFHDAEHKLPSYGGDQGGQAYRQSLINELIVLGAGVHYATSIVDDLAAKGAAKKT